MNAEIDNAKQILQRRQLQSYAERIADPAVKAKVAALANGSMSARDFARDVSSDPTVAQRLDRYVDHVLALSPQQRAEITRTYESKIDAIVQEQRQQVRPQPSRSRRRADDEEETWEDATFTVSAW